MTDDITRELPHAVGPEKSVLSTILQDPQEWMPVAIEERLSAAHFYLPAHQTLFDTIADLYRDGKPIELVSFIQHLIDFGKIERVGGPRAVADVYGYAPSPCYFRQHIREIREKQIGRALILEANRMIAAVYDSPGEILDTLEASEKALSAIAALACDSAPEIPVKDLVIAAMDAFEARTQGKADSMGIPMEPHLDQYLMGAHPGRMLIVAGYPEAGKSLLAMQMLLGPATSGVPCLYLSLELSAKDAADRAIIQHSRIAASVWSDPRARQGEEALTKSGMQHIQKAALEIARAPLRIKRASNRKLQTVVADIRKAHRERGIKIAVVDYAQKIQGPKSDSKTDETEEVSHALYELAVELGIFLILPSQLNADGDTKNGRVFEEDADAVLNIVQDRNKESATYKHHRYVLIVKDRHNSKGGERIPLVLNRDHLRFVHGMDETVATAPKTKFTR